MSATDYQRAVCRVIAANRIANGESYIAGGIALNVAINAARLSEDIDIFHDKEEAVAGSYALDRHALEDQGYCVEVTSDRGSFIDCTVSKNAESTTLQWVYDSAYRFFPLQTDPDFGLTLHPFDLATNKVLALVGRLVVRDWIDVVECHTLLQPLGYLAWSASGKDPGLSPVFILDQAHRSGRYVQVEVDTLTFEGNRPDARDLAVRWKQMLREAEEIVDILPADNVGTCVLDSEGNLLRASAAELKVLLASDKVRYHAGCLRGAYPVIKPGT